jgi:O-antigen/teichoic acid export membrane protein
MQETGMPESSERAADGRAAAGGEHESTLSSVDRLSVVAPSQVAQSPGDVEAARVSLRQMLRSASGTAVLQGFSNGAGLLTAILLARFLGREDYGRYAYSFAWASFLAVVATLGLDRFLVRGIAGYEVGGQWQLMKGLLRRTNQLVVLTSTTIAAGGCVVALVALSPSLRAPFCVAMAVVPVTAVTFLRQGAMQALGRVVSGQLPEYLIRPLLIIVGIVVLELLGGGALSATSALGINVGALVVATITGGVLLLRALPHELREIEPRYATRGWLRASLPMMLISGVWLLNNYVGTLVTGTIRGPSAAGVYNVVQNGAAVVVLFLVAANMPLAPVVARLHALGDRHQLESTTERVALVGLLVSAPVCGALALFPGFFLGIFGAGFKTGSTALTIVALGQLVNAAAGPAGNVLIMTQYEMPAVRAVGTGALVNLVLTIALAPAFGVTGSAIAFASSLVVWNVALVVVARRRLGINVTAFHRLAMTRR